MGPDIAPISLPNSAEVDGLCTITGWGRVSGALCNVNYVRFSLLILLIQNQKKKEENTSSACLVCVAYQTTFYLNSYFKISTCFFFNFNCILHYYYNLNHYLLQKNFIL